MSFEPHNLIAMLYYIKHVRIYKKKLESSFSINIDFVKLNRVIAREQSSLESLLSPFHKNYYLKFIFKQKFPMFRAEVLDQGKLLYRLYEIILNFTYINQLQYLFIN